MSDKSEALKALNSRRQESMEKGQIDDRKLYAGSPMHFYCHYCGTLTQVLPEDYTCAPQHVCEFCQVLIDCGWHDCEKPRFPYR